MSDPYDPTAPEGSSASNYMSKKDLKSIFFIVIVLVVASFPGYLLLQASSQSSRCVANMHAISSALSLYADSKDGRFPPAFAADDAGTNPRVLDAKTQMTFNWASEISIYLKSRDSLSCPAAIESEEEVVSSERPIDQNNVEDRSRKFGQELLSYGFYGAYSTYPIPNVVNPDRTIVVAESSSLGARGTLDPVLFKDKNGATIPDGFLLAWNNSNNAPDKKTTAISRLAFYAGGGSRHGNLIHALTASGSLTKLDRESAQLTMRGGDIQGVWQTPPILPGR